MGGALGGPPPLIWIPPNPKGLKTGVGGQGRFGVPPPPMLIIFGVPSPNLGTPLNWEPLLYWDPPLN